MGIVLYFFKALHVFRMSGLLREDSWILTTASTFNLVQWVVLFKVYEDSSPDCGQFSTPKLLLLSRFSRVRLCVTPQTAAHQAPPSLGFSRQEHWSGVPFPSPMHENEVAQSCPTLSNPMDCSPPGSSIHGIFQARILAGVGCYCLL